LTRELAKILNGLDEKTSGLDRREGATDANAKPDGLGGAVA